MCLVTAAAPGLCQEFDEDSRHPPVQRHIWPAGMLVDGTVRSAVSHTGLELHLLGVGARPLVEPTVLYLGCGMCTELAHTLLHTFNHLQTMCNA